MRKMLEKEFSKHFKKAFSNGEFTAVFPKGSDVDEALKQLLNDNKFKLHYATIEAKFLANKKMKAEELRKNSGEATEEVISISDPEEEVKAIGDFGVPAASAENAPETQAERVQRLDILTNHLGDLRNNPNMIEGDRLLQIAATNAEILRLTDGLSKEQEESTSELYKRLEEVFRTDFNWPRMNFRKDPTAWRKSMVSARQEHQKMRGLLSDLEADLGMDEGDRKAFLPYLQGKIHSLAKEGREFLELMSAASAAKQQPAVASVVEEREKAVSLDEELNANSNYKYVEGEISEFVETFKSATADAQAELLKNEVCGERKMLVKQALNAAFFASKGLFSCFKPTL